LEQKRPTQQILIDIKANIEKAIIGKSEAIDLVLVSLICSGHVLIEDVPGLGKRRLYRPLQNRLIAHFQEYSLRPTSCLPT
jgi:MoxR-like ATPase